MSLPAQLPKFLRLLASDKDFEVLAAARKIAAAAVAHDIDWDHVLANGARSEFSEEQAHRIYTEGFRRGEAAGYERGLEDAKTATPSKPPDPYQYLEADKDWAERVLAAATKPEAARVLNQRTLDFVESYAERVSSFGRRARIYPRQRDWLKDIESRLKYAGIIS